MQAKLIQAPFRNWRREDMLRRYDSPMQRGIKLMAAHNAEVRLHWTLSSSFMSLRIPPEVGHCAGLQLSNSGFFKRRML